MDHTSYVFLLSSLRPYRRHFFTDLGWRPAKKNPAKISTQLKLVALAPIDTSQLSRKVEGQ